jgi:outer membrane receptor protein involved in Fe transport
LGLTSAALQANYGLSPTIADLVIAQYAPFDPARTQAISNTLQKVTSYALFTDATWELNKSWDIFGGLRLDHESQENNSNGTYTILNGDKLPNPASYANTPYAGLVPLISGINDLLYSIAANASQAAQPSDAEFNTVLPKLGASYHFTKDLTTSFTAQQGYRSGGVGINSAKSSIYTYDPEFTNNYELSFRSVWLDGSLVANANLFYIDWTDQQVSVQLSSNTFDSETRNAGKSTVKGFELELSYELSHALKLYSSIGQAKTEFTDFTVVIPTSSAPVVYDLTGRSFAAAPEWTGSIGATYHGENGWFANINANFASESTAVINPYSDGLSKGDVGFDLKNDARTLLNLQLGYEWESVGVYLIGRNLLDKEYESSVSLRSPVLGEPRQLALSIRGKF